MAGGRFYGLALHKSSMGYQHHAILSQLPARLNLRQGQVCRQGISYAVCTENFIQVADAMESPKLAA